MKLNEYWKGVVAALGVVVSAAVAALEDGSVSTVEGGMIATAFFTFVGVVLVRNKQPVSEALTETPVPFDPGNEGMGP